MKRYGMIAGVLMVLAGTGMLFAQNTDISKHIASLEKLVANQALTIQELSTQNQQAIAVINSISKDLSALPAGFAPLDSLRESNGIKFDKDKKLKK